MTTQTQPTSGGTWTAGGYADLDSRLPQRGGLVCVAIRDNRGPLTNISPFNSDGSYNFSPFAVDNTMRSDLFAAQLINGEWQINENANQGYWNMGWFKESGGPDREMKVDSDDLMGLQSNWALDTDIVKQEKTIKLTPIETIKPVLHRIKRNQPLVDANGNNLVEWVGQPGYFSGQQLDADFVERQMLLIRRRTKGGKTVYTVEPVPLCKLVNEGNAKMDKKDADASELSFRLNPDNYFIIPDPAGSGEYVPGIDGIWIGGNGWTGDAGAPQFSGTPVAAPVTGLKATITFATPVGGVPPFTYSVTEQAGGTGPFTAATLLSPTGVVTGANTALTATTLTATTPYVFKPTVTDANGNSTTATQTTTITSTSS